MNIRGRLRDFRVYFWLIMTIDRARLFLKGAQIPEVISPPLRSPLHASVNSN